MKIILKQIAQSLILTGVLPAMMISSIANVNRNKISPPAGNTVPRAETQEITVLDKAGQANIMNLEEYICGVVLGEVSTQFHEEALKAQAVAARTYTLYCIDTLKKHSVGAVCIDSQCCQAYCEPEEFIRNGGTNNDVQKVREAVASTAGEVLYYGSKLICATYFASSGGRTEDALEVWGTTYPYLKAVASPGEEDCGYYYDRVTVSPEELMDTLGVRLIGNPSSWFGMVKYTAGEGVDLIRIGGRLYSGIELRKMFKLRSTIATISVADGNILIDTKGYGHRVGMSQHGANVMAKQEIEYRDILKYYYTDVEIASYSSKSNSNSS